ncbi:MAG: sigma-70 family RNA polymerase sigma factor [Planctomycetes bacterium]|nr:sigma-70 family RNA polymerase sigma factor [Planctomycetota bacterium]
MTSTTETRTQRRKRIAAARERHEQRERARRLVEQPIDYIGHESFDDPKAAAEILGPEPVSNGARLPRAPEGLPPYLAALYRFPLLTREQEAYYFRRMNFHKHRAEKLRQRLNVSRPSRKAMDQIEDDLRQASDIKNLLVRRNLRLVVSIARRFVRRPADFFEQVSDGNLSLMKAVDKFDYSRGFKFSTYATWAVQRNFSRSIPAEQTQLSRFRTGTDALFHERHAQGSSQFAQEHTNLQQRRAILDILRQLDGRERDILVTRFGLEPGTEPQTLEQVGNRFGVTKERIRQLESRALKKLRGIAEREKLEIPGI